MGFYLPIAFGNPFHFENDTLFAHEAEYEPFGLGRKPKNGLPYSNRPVLTSGTY